MNVDAIGFIAFIVLVSFFLIVKRRNITTHRFLHVFYFCMYQTKIGLRLMDIIAKRFSKILKKYSFLIIITCFVGMIFVSFELVRGIYNLLAQNQNLAVAVVLPFEIRGAFYVPFVYWILSILVIATIHEFSHGVIARLYNVRIKSSGFAFLGIILPLIPAAFVEPDEKQLQKKDKRHQLAVFAAGPFSNIALGLITLAIFVFALAPATNDFYDYNGVEIVDLVKDSPSEGSLIVGNVIREIDGNKIKNSEDFKEAFVNKKPGERVKILTNEKENEIILSENPKDKKDAYLGIFVKESRTLKNIGFFGRLLVYIKDFFFWMFVLNLGVGLFNLVPIGPLDGGRMFRTIISGLIHKRKAEYVLKTVSYVFLFIIVGSIVLGFVA